MQCELESALVIDNPALVLCVRGTVDGEAYWPGPDDFWQGLGTTRNEQLKHYHAVIHMRTPDVENGYDHANPLRHETVLQARKIDERIARVWADHPHRIEVPPSPRFLDKASSVLELVRRELPDCCRTPEHPTAK